MDQIQNINYARESIRGLVRRVRSDYEMDKGYQRKLLTAYSEALAKLATVSEAVRKAAKNGGICPYLTKRVEKAVFAAGDAAKLPLDKPPEKEPVLADWRGNPIWS
jgi:hypothetical protein